jgi:hypothetical protein
MNFKPYSLISLLNLKILGLIFFVLCFTGCKMETNKTIPHNQRNNSDTIYYEINPPSKNKASTFKPLPPQLFYGEHNFILYEQSKIFYHNEHLFHLCGTGIDYSKPPKIYLTADSLTEITIEELEQFLSQTLPQNQHVSASISSNTSNIKNDAFPIILQYLKVNNFSIFAIRIWTEEEENAFYSKTNSTSYHPKTANFKTGFDSDYSLLDSTKN